MSILAMPHFGDTLRRLRKARRLSQDELGAMANVNGQTVSNIETGKVDARGDTFRAIAAALGMTVEQLEAESADDGSRNVEPYSEVAIGEEIPLFDLPLAAGGWVEIEGDDDGEAKRPGVVHSPAQITRGLFRVRLRGDSMMREYGDGDIVEFRCIREDWDGVEPGKDFYFHLSDGTATFKRVDGMTEDAVVLRAINKRKYPKAMVVAKSLVVRKARAVARVELKG